MDHVDTAGGHATGASFDGPIGIDLGTTFSCVSVFRHDRAEVIPNDHGDRTSPSCVAFYDGHVLVGKAAQKLLLKGDSGVVFDAKRVIGCDFGDAAVKKHAKDWPFTISAAESGEGVRMRVQDSVSGTVHLLAPEQVSAEVLRYLKVCAERYLGKSVKKAVVTVPAYFNDRQRERTKVAGTIAGLEIVRLVNEPTAASLAFGFDCGKDGASRTNVLVFDLGGGTFDVSVVDMSFGFEVRATGGDTHLGGRDLDGTLCDYVKAQLKDHKDLPSNAEENPRIQARIKVACERAKIELSYASSTELTLEGILGGEDFTLSLTRAVCEELWLPFFSRCLSIMKNTIKDAKLQVTDFHSVILVGGSSRIPHIAEMLADFFGDAVEICRSVHPDEAVAIGAAIQGAMLSTEPVQQSERTQEMLLLDVIPLSIGIDVDDGRMDVIIPRNTTIPYRATKEYSTVEDNQRAVDIIIYEGERKLTKYNHQLGCFSLEGIAPAKKGEPTIVVTFSVDADGLLTVTATEEGGGGNTTSLTVRGGSHLTPSQIAQMIDDAKKFSEEDSLTRAKEEASRTLTNGFAAIEDAARGLTSDVLDAEEVRRRLKFLEHGKQWVNHTLFTMTDAAEMHRKVNKIAALQKKAHRALEKARRVGVGVKRPRDGSSHRSSSGGSSGEDSEPS